MRVAVTGATGFVGSSLARALAAEGAEIWGLARPDSNRQRLAGLPMTWRDADVTDPSSLRGAFHNVDWLVHAAGMLGKAGVPESSYHRLHVQGTQNVLSEAQAASVSRVLYISSPGVLGPITGAPADESARLAPSNAYERSKAAAEQVAMRFAAGGLPLVVGRPEFIYGPGDSHVLGLFRAVQRGRFFYVGRGRHTCHPTYTGDAVAGLLLCLQRGRPGEIYHLAGPRPVTFGELASTVAAALAVRPPRLMIPGPLAWLLAAGLEMLASATGRQPPLSRAAVSFFGESRRFSWQKAHREFGYSPRVDLAEGMQQTVGWYQREGWL